jgi:hypothetical protein
MAHKKGDENCEECREGYPVPCYCGIGLWHAAKGCIVMGGCDSESIGGNHGPVIESDSDDPACLT